MMSSRLFEELPAPESGIKLDLNDRLSATAAAAYLGIKPETLRDWRKFREKLAFTRVGKTPQYRVQWLEEHIEENKEERLD